MTVCTYIPNVQETETKKWIQGQSRHHRMSLEPEYTKERICLKKKGGEENKIKYFGGKYKWSIHSRSVKKSFLVKNLKHTQTQTYLKDEPW